MGPLLKVGRCWGVVRTQPSGACKDFGSCGETCVQQYRRWVVKCDSFLHSVATMQSKLVFHFIIAVDSVRCLCCIAERSILIGVYVLPIYPSSGPSTEAQDRRARNGKRSEAKVSRGCHWRLHAVEHRTRGCPEHVAGEVFEGCCVSSCRSFWICRLCSPTRIALRRSRVLVESVLNLYLHATCRKFGIIMLVLFGMSSRTLCCFYRPLHRLLTKPLNPREKKQKRRTHWHKFSGYQAI